MGLNSIPQLCFSRAGIKAQHCFRDKDKDIYPRSSWTFLLLVTELERESSSHDQVLINRGTEWAHLTDDVAEFISKSRAT